uniref:Uncharacterized protein n=1 Tax=Eutreptiella gymnastica TaxID=73025 RepID=A0A7S4G0L7_9EUGL
MAHTHTHTCPQTPSALTSNSSLLDQQAVMCFQAKKRRLAGEGSLHKTVPARCARGCVPFPLSLANTLRKQHYATEVRHIALQHACPCASNELHVQPVPT